MDERGAGASGADAEGAGAPDLLIRGALVVTMNPGREVYDPGFVSVRGGRIAAVGPEADCPGGTPPAAAVLDGRDRIVLPGFVNAHDHLLGAFSRGLGSDRAVAVTVPDASERPAARIRGALDEEAAYAAARLSLLELQLSGVTTTADSQPALAGREANADATLRALHESGARALWTRASLNRTGYVAPEQHDSLDVALAELERLAGRWSSGRVEVGCEAQALHRVEEDLLRGLAEWAQRRGAHFAMHLSYSEEAAAHALERFGRPLLLLLEEWGVLGPRFLGYHPVWVSDEEIEAAARSGAGLAFCPVDNMLIASGVAPVARLLAAGCRLGLGVDQPNDGHSVFELMKLSVLIQRVAHLDASLGGPEQALELATLGGARALHREHELGSLEPGKAADLVVLDGRRPAFAPFPGRISNLVYAAGPADVEHVFVGGEAVVRSGRHALWDEEDVVSEAHRAMRATLRRAGLPEDLRPYTSWPLS